MKLSDTGIGDVEIKGTRQQRWDALDYETQQAIIDIAESAAAIMENAYHRAAQYIKCRDLSPEEMVCCWDKFGSWERSQMKKFWNKP